MKIYTKTGDLGQTGLVDGQKVSKTHQRLQAYGTLDELNSHIGLLMVEIKEISPHFKEEFSYLQKIQGDLFQMGSQMACSDPQLATQLPSLNESDVKDMEGWIDELDQDLPELKNFILPGGHRAAAQAHVCRTVARRAERLCVELHSQAPLTFPGIPFLNRLSDFLFILARAINDKTQCHTPEWKPRA